MSYNLDEKLKNLTPYDPLVGSFRVRLDVNESFLPLPDGILTKFSEKIRETAFNRYPDPYCTELRKAFAGYYGVSPEEVTAGNGSDELISLITEIFLKDDGRVMVLLPDFSMYKFYTELRKGRVISYQKDCNYGVNVDDVIERIKNEKIDILIFSNPCNPTGGVISAKDVLRIAKSSACLVIADEAYMDFASESVLHNVNDYDNLIVLRTLSKLGGAAALRLGFAVTNPLLSKVLKGAKSVYNVNGVSQAFGAIIYDDGKFLDESRETIIKSVNYLYGELSSIAAVMGSPFKVFPTASNFIFIETQKADAIYEKLLGNGIAVRRFKNAIRINAGSDYENSELLKTLRSL